MNLEKRELHPQLLDRMSLHTGIATIEDPKLRVDVMRSNTHGRVQHNRALKPVPCRKQVTGPPPINHLTWGSRSV